MIVGRVADAVVLSSEGRSFLEAQVRRHKAQRSLADRCRMILPCADGLQSKEVDDRLNVHEHTVGKAWLERRSHWRVHFTPTSAPWINEVEGWFAELTRKQFQRGVHRSPLEF